MVLVACVTPMQQHASLSAALGFGSVARGRVRYMIQIARESRKALSRFTRKSHRLSAKAPDWSPTGGPTGCPDLLEIPRGQESANPR